MNNFDAKYIKISSKYLQEKIDMLNARVRSSYVVQEKKESKVHRLINSIFKS